jgi:uncharacterized protein YdeI (YjbR/CyaY-like superfamily)
MIINMSPTFFVSPTRLRQWLARNHNKQTELWIGFHKKNSKKKSISYNEALDEALCYGWIDGVRKGLDEDSYTIRFTPRKPRSIWSVVNTKRMKELIELGRVEAPGMETFTKRDPKRTKLYAFENRPRSLSPEFEAKFRANKKAWEFFQQQPPGYKRLVIFRIMEAKQEQTRVRRLDQLIDASASNSRLGLLTGKKS